MKSYFIYIKLKIEIILLFILLAINHRNISLFFPINLLEKLALSLIFKIISYFNNINRTYLFI
jgi:hypothetical protein